VTVPPRIGAAIGSSDRSGNQTNDRAHDERMTELRQLFFETAAELVQKLNEEAMQLEQSPSDAEAARSLRRTVHTLKGDAAACGFREFSELCHEFEDVLALENPATAPRFPPSRCALPMSLRPCWRLTGKARNSQHRVFTSGDRPSGAPGRQRRGKIQKQGPETLGEESTLVGV